MNRKWQELNHYEMAVNNNANLNQLIINDDLYNVLEDYAIKMFYHSHGNINFRMKTTNLLVLYLINYQHRKQQVQNQNKHLYTQDFMKYLIKNYQVFCLKNNKLN